MGAAVQGGGGAYRYDHPDGTAVHVHPVPEGPGWGVSVDPTGSHHSGGPRELKAGLERGEAFEYAHGWMEGYEKSGEEDRGRHGFTDMLRGGGPGVGLR